MVHLDRRISTGVPEYNQNIASGIKMSIVTMQLLHRACRGLAAHVVGELAEADDPCNMHVAALYIPLPDQTMYQ
jgi:hypothetical protein